MRYFVFLEYNGSNYIGIQRQNQGNTIQNVIEKNLKKLFKKDIVTTISSRTDSGVHALKNCIHFDLSFNINCEIIKNCLNKILPYDINILNIVPVIESAHCRFSAIKREYKYIITSKRSVFKIGYYYDKFKDLDIEKMNKVANYLTEGNNEKCYKTFSKTNSTEKHDYKCIVYESFWGKINDDYVFKISANRFLHSLIRSLVNAMIYVGINKITFEDFKERLLSENRNNNLGLAPSNGLILTNIEYNNDIFLS